MNSSTSRALSAPTTTDGEFLKPFMLRWSARLLCLLVATIALTGCSRTSGSLARPQPRPGYFFVATNGNDSWSGLVPVPNSERTDGPFQTLSRALEASRAYQAVSRSSGGARAIYLCRGTHFLNEPLRFNSQDSQLLVAAYGTERPVLSGGTRIVDWQERQFSGQKLWVAPAESASGEPWRFHQLWVNGRRAIRARHPNQGYLSVAAVPDTTKVWTEGQSRFQFKSGDLENWPTISQAEVVVMSRWVESRLPILQVQPGTNVVSFGKRAMFQLAAGDPYYLEGAFEALDQPGEWFLDTEKNLVFYKPRPGETLAQLSVIAPVLPQLVFLDGTSENPIKNLRFVDVDFSHTEWYFPKGFEVDTTRQSSIPATPAVGGFAQAAIGVPGAVVGKFVLDSSFDRCRFTNLGGYALELARGCQRNTIGSCDFTDLGAGGLRLGETEIRTEPEDRAGDNTVIDCRFAEGGRIFHSGIGIWIGQSPGNRLLHNEIHDFYYTGISVGWTWGYGPALATNTLVAFNLVHHIGVQSNGDGPILSDMGGIYTLGRHHGSVIANNLWHDIAGLRYGGWGIYFDEGTSGMLAVSNVVYRTTHGGFHQHYGATNKVFNNIFAFGVEHQLQRTRPEQHPSFSFATNIVYSSHGLLLGGNWDGALTMDWNLYCDTRPTALPARLNFYGGTVDQWHARGYDRNSRIEDPLFVDPGNGDFTLRPGSPAFRLGFRPIQLQEVGPRRPAK
jgi:hypothetical protein